VRARLERGPALAVALLFCLACVDSRTGRPQTLASVPAQPDPGSGPFLCSVADGLELRSIEDFELGAAGAGWFTNNNVCESCQPIIDDLNDVVAQLAAFPADQTLLAKRGSLLDELAPCRTACQASQQPSIFDKPLPAERIPWGARCGSFWALHARTAQLTGWGGNLAVRFTPPFDAHDYKGIALWGRVAPGSRNSLRVELADRYTDDKFLLPDGTSACNATATLDSLPTGCDRFGGYAVLDADWRLFLIPFVELRQAGWGKRAPGLDLAALRTLSFTWGPGTWDIWIDDVAFYR
jgi:hypothetical protein